MRIAMRRTTTGTITTPLAQAWEREKAAELERAAKLFTEAHEFAAKEAQRMAQIQRHEQARQQLHGELLALREEKVPRSVPGSMLHDVAVLTRSACCVSCTQLQELQRRAAEAAEAAERQRRIEERQDAQRALEAEKRKQQVRGRAVWWCLAWLGLSSCHHLRAVCRPFLVCMLHDVLRVLVGAQISEYQRQKQEEEAWLAAERRREAQEAAAKAAEQAAVNAQRVEVRERMYQNKVEEHVNLQRERELEAQARKRRVDALAKQTPYYDKLAAMKPDFDHVLQHTKATKIAEEIGRFHSELLKREAEGGVTDDALVQHRIAEKGLFAPTGYNEKQVFKDVRFKVSCCSIGLRALHSPLTACPFRLCGTSDRSGSARSRCGVQLVRAAGHGEAHAISVRARGRFVVVVPPAPKHLSRRMPGCTAMCLRYLPTPRGTTQQSSSRGRSRINLNRTIKHTT